MEISNPTAPKQSSRLSFNLKLKRQRPIAQTVERAAGAKHEVNKSEQKDLGTFDYFWFCTRTKQSF